MTPSHSGPVEPVPDRVAQLGRMLGRGAVRPRSGMESVGAGDVPQPPAPADVPGQVDTIRGELHRIVKDYLGGGRDLYDVADKIAASGGLALTAYGRDGPAAFERQPDLLAGLEAIVRTDGSRPTFLIREGIVDRQSSPIGTWGPALDGDATDLEAVIACVGRIDDPANLIAGYDGTGFLVAPNLILTNRHVLQAIGWKNNDGTWGLTDGLTIDFGHEFRGRVSVGPRKLRRVAFAGPDLIDLHGPVDHAKLDLAAIEIEPAAATPPTLLSVDASPDWAATGATDVYTIGYPFKPPLGEYKPKLLEQLFQQTYGCKRLAPGETLRSKRTTQGWTSAHDATTLGGNSGSVVVVAGRAVIAAALHYGGNPAEPAENWGHVLGRVLDTAGTTGRTLRQIFDDFDVVLSDRTVTPPAGPAGGAPTAGT
jgi:Trypsin-like peptidase domain